MFKIGGCTVRVTGKAKNTSGLEGLLPKSGG
jgi:hypothetical protein